MKPSRALTVFVGVLFAFVGTSSADRWKAPAEVSIQNILKEALAEKLAPDVDIVVSLVEIPPHTILDRHWHPGEEFVYTLEGEAKLLLADQEPIMAKAGQVLRVPFKQVHTAETGDVGAKVLVFRVHQRGQPVRHLVDGGSSEK